MYYFVKRNWTRDEEDARDLTQGFFVSFLERDFLSAVDADRGRFRNFVCVALRNFLSNEHRAAHAKKRHPASGLFSLDKLIDEARLQVPDTSSSDPVEQFKEDWRAAVLEAVLASLRKAACAADKEVLYDIFIKYDIERFERAPGERLTHDDLAKMFGVTYSQVRNGLTWIRKIFEGLLIKELGDQVLSEEDLRQEADELFRLKV